MPNFGSEMDVQINVLLPKALLDAINKAAGKGHGKRANWMREAFRLKLETDATLLPMRKAAALKAAAGDREHDRHAPKDA